MADLTIVSDHAERLVRDGGVHNDDARPHQRERYRYSWLDVNENPVEEEGERLVEVETPFTADVLRECGLCITLHHGPRDPAVIDDHRVGTVTVTEVHHSHDERCAPPESPCPERADGLHCTCWYDGGPCHNCDVHHGSCHPDAEEGWHWVVTPLEKTDSTLVFGKRVEDPLLMSIQGGGEISDERGNREAHAICTQMTDSDGKTWCIGYHCPYCGAATSMYGHVTGPANDARLTCQEEEDDG